jgi:hypothetical protein
MPVLTRPRWLIAIPLVVLFLVFAVGLVLLVRGQGIKSRAALISIGMSREQVEGILGPPVLILPRTAGRGTALCWVDQLWQVDVLIDRDGRVESVGCIPSDSLLRRTMGRVIALPH